MKIKVFNRGSQEIKDSLVNIKNELDDHLEAINQHECDMNEVVSQIERLQEAVEQLQLRMGYSQVCDDINIELSFMEKKIFMILYAFETKVTVDEIASRLKIAAELVDRHIGSLQKKGISIWRQRSLDGKTYLLLDREFRELQAKSNFLQLNQKLAKQLVVNNMV